MYEELVKRLRSYAKLDREYNGSGKPFEDAADAIEELLKAAKAMHTWIFLNSVDEQKAYDECGLTDEMNAALGYGGRIYCEAAERDNLKGDKSMIIIRTNLEKMPTTCCDCPLKVHDPHIVWRDALMTQWGGWVCPISGQLIDNMQREEFCPLEEIPEPPKEEA